MEDPVKRLKVSHDPKANTFEAYFLSNGKLFRCTGRGNKEEVGHMDGRELIKKNAAQSMYKTFLQGLVTRDGRAYGWKVAIRTTTTLKGGGSRTSYNSRTYPF